MDGFQAEVELAGRDDDGTVTARVIKVRTNVTLLVCIGDLGDHLKDHANVVASTSAVMYLEDIADAVQAAAEAMNPWAIDDEAGEPS